MASPLREKTVVLTGATSGIGEALAQELLTRGARVIALIRRPDAAPEGVTVIQTDLTQREQITNAFDQLKEIHALVNCAGVAYQSPIIDGNPGDWEEMWQVNVMALALCSQLALSHFPNGGRILNVSSLSGHRVPSTGGFYASTKFAVRAITDALRLEIKAAGLPVQVGTISPGFVDTPLLDNYFRGREQALAETKQKIRMLTASDVAAAILFMLETPPHVEIGDIQLRSSDQFS